MNIMFGKISFALGFIPNSTCRRIFRRKEIKPVVIKEFELRLVLIILFILLSLSLHLFHSRIF